MVKSEGIEDEENRENKYRDVAEEVNSMWDYFGLCSVNRHCY